MFSGTKKSKIIKRISNAWFRFESPDEHTFVCPFLGQFENIIQAWFWCRFQNSRVIQMYESHTSIQLKFDLICEWIRVLGWWWEQWWLTKPGFEVGRWGDVDWCKDELVIWHQSWVDDPGKIRTIYSISSSRINLQIFEIRIGDRMADAVPNRASRAHHPIPDWSSSRLQMARRDRRIWEDGMVDIMPWNSS